MHALPNSVPIPDDSFREKCHIYLQGLYKPREMTNILSCYWLCKTDFSLQKLKRHKYSGGQCLSEAQNPLRKWKTQCKIYFRKKAADIQMNILIGGKNKQPMLSDIWLDGKALCLSIMKSMHAPKPLCGTTPCLYQLLCQTSNCFPLFVNFPPTISTYYWLLPSPLIKPNSPSIC